MGGFCGHDPVPQCGRTYGTAENGRAADDHHGFRRARSARRTAPASATETEDAPEFGCGIVFVLATSRRIRHDISHFLLPKERSGGVFMGTGRTLRKNPRTRPIKSQGEKRRRYKVQRARLVKLGMDETAVAKLQVNVLRTLVQQPEKVKKAVAKQAEKAAVAV
jgi:hypothetical protein